MQDGEHQEGPSESRGVVFDQDAGARESRVAGADAGAQVPGVQGGDQVDEGTADPVGRSDDQAPSASISASGGQSDDQAPSASISASGGQSDDQAVGGGTGSDEPSDDAPAPAPAPATAPGAGRSHARRRAVRRRRRRIVLGAAGLVVVVLAAMVGWYELQAHPGGPQGKAVVISVNNGESVSAVVGDLADHQVVTSDLAFRIFLFVHGSPTIRPGSYLMHESQSFADARQDLANGPNVTTVEVLPGLTMSELAQRYAGATGSDPQEFLNVAASGEVTSPYQATGSNNLEGLVAPGTYTVLPGETAKQVLQQMVDRFDQMAAQVGATPEAAQALGVTPNQLVTVASIVEKEGVYPVNLGPVARVIYNRLANNMPLQMDSTVLYALGRDGGTVTEQDLQTQTPYNTYLHTGLTPTPVAFPSKAALQAAAHPPLGNWLYFVVVNKSGLEAFSDTYAEQLQNEALARQRGLG